MIAIFLYALAAAILAYKVWRWLRVGDNPNTFGKDWL